jgi:hypothetical protein
MHSNENAGKIIENVQARLRREFSGLDWDYMQDRLCGELFCDLAITYHPKDPIPMVGLWKLAALEASYGRGGYLKGTIHNHNTLSFYGGLQAEMRSNISERSHISFRSSYSLNYEPTRLKSNSRSLFEEKDVYQMHENVFVTSERVLNIFTERAPKRSYGVRDEFRIGYAALTEVSRGLEAMVKLPHVNKPMGC